MSAFIVSDQVISIILQAASPNFPGESVCYYWDGQSHNISQNNLDKVGQKLLDENYRSINHLYSHVRIGVDTAPHQFILTSERQQSPVSLIKICNGYMYQACETDNWEQTEAYAIVNDLRERAIRNLPGYEEAKWTW